MTEIISLSAIRAPAESAAWSSFLNARLAYMEHQSSVTRVAVQSAFQAFALSMGLSREQARQASDRLDAINGWSQSPGALIGAIH